MNNKHVSCEVVGA